MSDETVSIHLTGTEEVAGAVGYEIEHVELDGGQTQVVRLTFDLWELEASVDFHVDHAEDFIVRFRDAVVRAKQARLEWETNTDPDSGIAGECDD